MMQRVNIRSANTADIADMLKIERLCFSDPWSEQLFSSAMASPMYEFYAAVTDDTLAGFLILCKGYDDINVDNIAVHPEQRRHGIARALLTFAQEKYPDVPFLLEVRESNAPAIGLYESLGYIRVGFRKRYYQNPAEGAVLMTRICTETIG